MKIQHSIKSFLILCIFQSFLTLVYNNSLVAQSKNLIVRGTILCYDEGDPDRERPLSGEWVVVVPKKFPHLAVLPDDKGLFNIVLPRNCINNNVEISFYCKNTIVQGLNKFISKESLRKEAENKIFKIESVKIKKACEFLYLNFDSCHDELNDFIKKNNKLTNRKSLYYKGGGILTILGSTVAALFLKDHQGQPPPSDTTFIDVLRIKSIKSPKIDLATLTSMQFLGNGPFNGTNFAPRYNFERALFLNSSSLVFSDFHNLNVRTDITKLIKFYQGSGFALISSRIGFGGGFVFLHQNEKTLAALTPESTHSERIPSTEFLGLVAIAFKVNESLSLGVSTKYLRQKIEIPIDVIKFHTGDVNSPSTIFRTSKIDSSHVDFDLSFTINPSRLIRLGINCNNILGKDLINQSGKFVKTRSIGIGINYKKQRVIAGVDVLMIENSKTNLAFGLNYILSNRLDLNSSFLTRYNSFQIGTSLKFGLLKLNYSFNYNNLYNVSHLLGLSLII